MSDDRRHAFGIIGCVVIAPFHANAIDGANRRRALEVVLAVLRLGANRPGCRPAAQGLS